MTLEDVNEALERMLGEDTRQMLREDTRMYIEFVPALPDLRFNTLLTAVETLHHRVQAGLDVERKAPPAMSKDPTPRTRGLGQRCHERLDTNLHRPPVLAFGA